MRWGRSGLLRRGDERGGARLYSSVSRWADAKATRRVPIDAEKTQQWRSPARGDPGNVGSTVDGEDDDNRSSPDAPLQKRRAGSCWHRNPARECQLVSEKRHRR
jgi:hypothetical protein